LYNESIRYAEGCFIYDEYNNKYADFDSGVWTLSLGHNNRRINMRIMDQLYDIMHTGYGYTHHVVEDAAGKVLKLADFKDGKCLFLTSGSEAVEFSIKLAKKIMSKPMFFSLENHYLSAYGDSGNYINSNDWITLDWQGNINDCDSVLEGIPFDKIGAFVFEPGNASGLVKLPPNDLIGKIALKVKENDGLIIVDEVTTGIGRTGKWFGFENYDIKPDIVACGKGIGNGYPVSVAVLNEGVCDLIEESDFTYGQSHMNDPLGCAVICEVIDVIKKENLLNNSLINGMYLKEGLISLSKKYSSIKEVRGIGLMCAMEFHDEMEDEKLLKLHEYLYHKGFIVGLKLKFKTIRFYPPLIVEKYLIERLLSSLNEVLKIYR